MPHPKPAWHALFSDLDHHSTASLQHHDLISTIRHVQSGERIVIVTNREDRAGWVPLIDLARLEILKRHPEIQDQLDAEIQNMGDDQQII